MNSNSPRGSQWFPARFRITPARTDVISAVVLAALAIGVTWLTDGQRKAFFVAVALVTLVSHLVAFVALFGVVTGVIRLGKTIRTERIIVAVAAGVAVTLQVGQPVPLMPLTLVTAIVAGVYVVLLAFAMRA